MWRGVLLARIRHGKGPTAAVRVLSTISLFQDSGPNTGRAERPSEILQLANLGVGHRMQRRKQHTNTNTHDDNNEQRQRHGTRTRRARAHVQSAGAAPTASQRRIGPL